MTDMKCPTCNSIVPSGIKYSKNEVSVRGSAGSYYRECKCGCRIPVRSKDEEDLINKEP